MKTIHFLLIGIIGLTIMFGMFLSESKLIMNDMVFLPLCAVTGISTGIGLGRVMNGQN